VEQIGKYKVIDVIARGGSGVIYRAVDPCLGRIVAIKALSAPSGAEAEIRGRFFLEARIAAALSHKNIVTIFELNDDPLLPNIVMEYLEGEDLKHLISRQIALPIEQKLRILIEVCEGLSCAHGKGVIHRDIKPGNIFVTRAGTVKLLDFGLARTTSFDPSQPDLPMGTPAYMSPEQLRGQPLDQRTDIFSLGVVAYELLTHVRPFRSETEMSTVFKIMQSDPEPMENVEPTIPIELSSVVGVMLEKDPEKRYRHVKDLCKELESIAILLEERKRILRVEIRDALSHLEELIAKNKDRLGEVAGIAAQMRLTAPEFFETAVPSDVCRLTPWRRELQLDYAGLIKMHEQVRRESARALELVGSK
jgi:serine/threonine protein kinase